MIHTREKKQAASMEPQILAGKEIKSSYYNMFKELKETMFKGLSMLALSHQEQNINGERNDLKGPKGTLWS